MEESRIIIKPVVAQQFEHSMKHGRIFFLSAPCGFGKTVVAEELLRGRKVRRMQAEKPDFERAETDPDWKILLVDDLQLMQEEEQQRLCELIRKKTERRFVLLSRGVPPGCLLAFGYTVLMTVVDADGLLFDREDIRTLFRNRQVEVTDSEISAILKKSIGYPMGVELTAQLMAGGRSFTPGLVAQAYREVFRYFEAAVYRRFDLPIRRLLLEMAPFDRFDMAILTWGSCWSGCRVIRPCCAMTASPGFISGRSSGNSCCGRWSGNTRRSSAVPSIAAAACTMNCGMIIPTRWSATPAVESIPGCRTF